MFLSTHRAKGLENERVFILEPDILPLVWEHQKEWQYEQEVNIKYVALTRSKRELILLTDKPMATKATNAAIEEAKRRADIFSKLYG